jgi:hypothetical protein
VNSGFIQKSSPKEGFSLNPVLCDTLSPEIEAEHIRSKSSICEIHQSEILENGHLFKTEVDDTQL